MAAFVQGDNGYLTSCDGSDLSKTPWEIRCGKLITSCECVKRNGLQNECTVPNCVNKAQILYEQHFSPRNEKVIRNNINQPIRSDTGQAQNVNEWKPSLETSPRGINGYEKSWPPQQNNGSKQEKIIPPNQLNQEPSPATEQIHQHSPQYQNTYQNSPTMATWPKTEAEERQDKMIEAMVVRRNALHEKEMICPEQCPENLLDCNQHAVDRQKMLRSTPPILPQQYNLNALPQQYNSPVPPQQYNSPVAPQPYNSFALPQPYSSSALPQQYNSPVPPQQYNTVNPYNPQQQYIISHYEPGGKEFPHHCHPESTRSQHGNYPHPPQQHNNLNEINSPRPAAGTNYDASRYHQPVQYQMQPCCMQQTPQPCCEEYQQDSTAIGQGFRLPPCCDPILPSSSSPYNQQFNNQPQQPNNGSVNYSYMAPSNESNMPHQHEYLPSNNGSNFHHHLPINNSNMAHHKPLHTNEAIFPPQNQYLPRENTGNGQNQSNGSPRNPNNNEMNSQNNICWEAHDFKTPVAVDLNGVPHVQRYVEPVKPKNSPYTSEPLVPEPQELSEYPPQIRRYRLDGQECK